MDRIYMVMEGLEDPIYEWQRECFKALPTLLACRLARHFWPQVSLKDLRQIIELCRD